MDLHKDRRRRRRSKILHTIFAIFLLLLLTNVVALEEDTNLVAETNPTDLSLASNSTVDGKEVIPEDSQPLGNTATSSPAEAAAISTHAEDQAEGLSSSSSSVVEENDKSQVAEVAGQVEERQQQQPPASSTTEADTTTSTANKDELVDPHPQLVGDDATDEDASPPAAKSPLPADNIPKRPSQPNQQQGPPQPPPPPGGPKNSKPIPVYKRQPPPFPKGPVGVATSGEEEGEPSVGYDTDAEAQRLKDMETAGGAPPLLNAIGFTVCALVFFAFVLNMGKRVMDQAAGTTVIIRTGGGQQGNRGGHGVTASQAPIIMDHTTQLDSSNLNLSSSRGREEEGGGGGDGSMLPQNRHLSTINPLQFHNLRDVPAQPSTVNGNSNGAARSMKQYRSICGGCRVNSRTHALVPCSHLVCESCANKAAYCPICKSSIVGKNWVISP